MLSPTRTRVRAVALAEAIVDEEPTSRDRVARHRVRAKQLLALAAQRATPQTSPPLAFVNRDNGAPAPDRGWHWSKADTRGSIVVAVASQPVGVDVERFGRPRLSALAARFGAETQSVCGTANEGDLLAGWCSREAVLKKLGLGLAGLARTEWRDLRDVNETESLATIRIDAIDHCVRLVRRREYLYAITLGDLEGAALSAVPFSCGEPAS